MDLDVIQYLAKAKKKQDPAALQAAFNELEEMTEADSGGTLSFDQHMYISCAEVGLQLGCLDITAACLKKFFDGNPPADQYLCRAFLCQNQLKCTPPTGTMADFKEDVQYCLKAIDISKKDKRSHYIVFNASVLYLQTVRPLLQPGRCCHLVTSLRQVVKSLEMVADKDHSWRAELMMHLIDALLDAGKMDDAASYARITEEFIRKHCPHLYSNVFRLQVWHNLSKREIILKKSRQSTALTVIYKLLQCKRGLGEISEDELAKKDLNELEEIFSLLGESTKPSLRTPIPPANRVSFLLELAFLALQGKNHRVADKCLKRLRSAGETSIGEQIMMECINCEINLRKKETKMNDYSKSSVEARLKAILKLNQCLQAAVREGDPQAVQAVCATQWSFCLPLLQHNLRRHVKTPLSRVAQALEDMQCMLFQVRCQVHAELAVTEEEDGLLEASLNHLQKAMQLDNGTQKERLSSAFHLLQLRRNLYQTRSRTEDKAAMLMQQVKDRKPQQDTDFRPLLLTVGQLLAPADFQMLLNADNISKITKATVGCGPIAQLSAEAHNYYAAVQKLDGYLDRQGENADNTESDQFKSDTLHSPKADTREPSENKRLRLWATLAKTARKEEVWDVCRVACRFCLLYDEARSKMSKCHKSKCSEEESSSENLSSYEEIQPCPKKLRLLAEICFITAEATAQKLQMLGVQLNSPAVLPQDVGVSEDDKHWIIYRDWIQDLSGYATSTFLRAAELGTQIREPWVVANSAIYLWNYNKHLLVTGDYNCLIPTFQSLVEMFQKTECTGNHALLVLLCDAVARGLYQHLAVLDNMEQACPQEKGKVKSDKMSSAPSTVLEPDNLIKVQKAFELCNYALSISNCNTTGETVPIAVQKQVVATWVRIKTLQQQHTGCNTETDEKNEEYSPMTRVLIAVEMLQSYKNASPLEGYDPSLSTLVSMVSNCNWTDAVVELQTWCQLAAFCHHAKEYSLVLSCTERAMQLEDAALKCLNTTPCLLYGLPAVNEMLSTAACLRGLSSIHQSIGDIHMYKTAMDMLLSSIRYALKAGHPELCFTAARHYWNNCLPLTHSPEERHQLKEPLEAILNALLQTHPKHTNKQDKVKQPQKGVPLGSSKPEAQNEEVLTLRSSMYCLLLQIYIDRTDLNGALQLLDNAVRDMPGTKHRLLLLKYRIQMKARLGESVLMDMQTLQGKEEQNCSLMWHKAALCSCNETQQMTCYQKSVTSLMSEENQWQKVSFLLAFGAWLYCHNMSAEEAQHQVQWAIDILLHLATGQSEKSEDESKEMDLGSSKCETLAVVQGLSFTQTVSSLKEVQRLDSLVQAHTLLAVMADRNSSEHQFNLLRAYDFVLQIWQVSAEVVSMSPGENVKGHSPNPAGNKKDKAKGKKPSPTASTPKPVLEPTLPHTLEYWVKYTCPDQVRYTFKTNCSMQCINIHTITNQTQSLFYLDLLEKELNSLSLSHLTLPIMHLAETFAHDLLDRKSLSDLYRLRIVRTCCQLGMESHSSYHESLLSLMKMQEQEQIRCHRAITLLQERRRLYKSHNQKTNTESRLQRRNSFRLDIWVDKADACIEMGLYQGARQLLAEAQLVALEFDDQTVMPRILLSMATLACEEHNHAEALYLLDKAQAMTGDEHFWYKFTLTKVAAVVGQRPQDAQTKIDQIIKQGCEALTVVLKQRLNRVSEITFLIESLKMRGAIECICAISGGEPGVTLSTKEFQLLKAACDTLGQCASVFTQLNYRAYAAKSHEECTYGLRFLAYAATDKKEKQRFLLDALSHMQLSISEQERVVLNAENLLQPEEASSGVILSPKWTLLRLRLSLADVCLAILEEHCEEIVNRALTKDKTIAEIAIEDFMRSIPETNSIEQEWMNVGSTLGQMALGQLAAVNTCSLDDLEMRAHCLCLMGKTLRLLAVQEDPVYMSSLWKNDLKLQGTSDPTAKITEEENSVKERESVLSSKESRMTSAKSTEPQQKKRKVELLLAQASNVLSETVSLCLQHNLSASILSDASLNMLECLGNSHHELACQYLALFQSACIVDVMADVLSLACDDTSVSQLSALLSLYRKLLVSQEGRPTKMLEGVRHSLNNISKAFSQLTINPNHLNLLAELSSDLKIILLQHSKDGSELYGALYKVTESQENQKGKTPQGSPSCSKVAKASVCPRALLALREQTRAFDQKMRHALLKETCLHDGRVKTPEEDQISHPRSDEENALTLHFRDIVHQMEEYLNPLISQFDFSFLSSPVSSNPVSEERHTKCEDKKGTTGDEAPPRQPGEFVVLLADWKLMELPLEALSILQGDLLKSVSRDFSLQLLCSRIPKEEPVKVEKETKGGKGMKGKANQSQVIKAISTSHVLPERTIPVDTRNFKCIFNDKDIVNTFSNFEATSLVERMKMNWPAYGQHFNHLLAGFMSIKQTPSFSEMEKLLSKCSGFLYLGAERFLAPIPPAKLAALNLSECHMALIFDLVQSNALHSSNLDMHKRAGQRTLEKTSEVALLLSLNGVTCIVLNQWHSSLEQNSEYMTNFLDNFLSGRQTSGQIVHSLRQDDDTSDSNDSDTVLEESFQHKTDLTPSAFNCVLYGLPLVTGT
ncbi:cilia- and flagella-associated protein 46 isoform X1 [Corythoichthys intestinalis]|uniref:cilia- and flagella-associated protein 46 isoform X1 n=1 Tax=Corythoichthys intestinalis TaxID=161448 RepID=UPI0025A657CE|nr:cilia- and flagella-associated protein 46 isoform X1 [Corythoichthys intestinalis]XP_057703979.1 cilia- and flagella-associated protein 46 isoform X1 [Corythoichthys intestinalis]XP_057703980.1 cilia- and flagella-associated protein 46 isoform X1 [Corythoichthys intestinalis]XP_057703981.1 cilia- and flagella-associated protein 46 isoform X1 [Corythoichthys intestinalis]XP_057703983.1 cilia- and flagella-associated protein 46 isoform X1 [Corythoichthys intestinalis]